MEFRRCVSNFKKGDKVANHTSNQSLFWGWERLNPKRVGIMERQWNLAIGTMVLRRATKWPITPCISHFFRGRKG